jgi:hypothetical protein
MALLRALLAMWNKNNWNRFATPGVLGSDT